MTGTLITSLRTRYDIVCSTDVVGFLGNPQNAEKFWSNVIPTEYRVGLEVIAFYHHLNNAKKIKNIAGYHARCDSILKPHSTELIMRPVNASMADPNHLYKSIGDQSESIYINSHNLFMENFQKKSSGKNVYTLCENDNLKGSYEQSIRIGKKYDGSIFDLVHYCVEKSGKVGWEKTIDESIEKIYEIGQCIVHISWGWHKRDALPEELLPVQLSRLSKAISDTNSFPVLEFQWGNAHGSFGCDPNTDPKKHSNASEKIRRLIDAGIIKKKG